MVLLGLLVLGIDRAALSRAESLVASRVAEAVGSPVQARVGGVLPGWRVLLADRIDRLDLHARDVAIPGTDVVIDDLVVAVFDLRLGADERPVAGEGRFVAAFGEAQVRASVPPGVADLVRLDADGLRIDVGIASVPLVLSVVGEAIEIGLPGELPLLDRLLGGSNRVPIDVPDRVVVLDASVVDGRVELSGTLDPVVLSL